MVVAIVFNDMNKPLVGKKIYGCEKNEQKEITLGLFNER